MKSTYWERKKTIHALTLTEISEKISKCKWGLGEWENPPPGYTVVGELKFSITSSRHSWIKYILSYDDLVPILFDASLRYSIWDIQNIWVLGNENKTVARRTLIYLLESKDHTTNITSETIDMLKTIKE